jgi:hypothetical protein
LRFRQEIFDNIFTSGITQVKTISHPRWQKEKILTVMFPRQLPGWRLELVLSHTKQKVFRWLIVKSLYGELSRREKQILRIMGAILSNQEFLIAKFILSNEFELSEYPVRQQCIPILQEKCRFPSISKDYLNSYQPALDFFRIWTKRRSLKPIRFIGVGYNDHGHLSSVPSWKEQILYSDNTGDIYESDFLLTRLKSSLRLVP